MALNDASGKKFGDDLQYESLVMDFEYAFLLESDVLTNDYVQNLIVQSDLHILHEDDVRMKFGQARELGLFRLFLPRQTLEMMCQWANMKLNQSTSFSGKNYNQGRIQCICRIGNGNVDRAVQ